MVLARNSGLYVPAAVSNSESSAVLPPASRVRRGTVEVREEDVIDIRLTPLTAGTYPVRCTHLLHTAYGMKGEAIVG